MLRAEDHVAAPESPFPSPQEPRRHVPGEEGVWVIIFGDLIVFGLFFATFCYYRTNNSSLFASSQLMLDQPLGLINTLLLLTSSWFVATFSERAREGDHAGARRFLVAAMACGGAFIAIKAVEYGRKIQAGISLTSNDFFTLYFMYTGIHLIHVIIGLGVLFYLYRVASQQVLDRDGIRTIEAGASFWHLVDILWIILFALFYVMH